MFPSVATPQPRKSKKTTLNEICCWIKLSTTGGDKKSKRNERNEHTVTERRLQEAGERIRTASVQRVSTVAARDAADDDSEVSPMTTPRSSSGSHKHRRGTVGWDRDEDDWNKENMMTQAATREKETEVDEATLKQGQDTMAKREMTEARKLEWEEKQNKLIERRI